MATNHSGNRSYNRERTREQNQYGAHGYGHNQMRNMQGGQPQTQIPPVAAANFAAYGQFPQFQYPTAAFDRQAAAQMPPYTQHPMYAPMPPYAYGYHHPQAMQHMYPQIQQQIPAHSSPTPPMHTQQQQQQQQQPPPQQPPAPTRSMPRQNRALKIVDPDTKKEIDLSTVRKEVPAGASAASVESPAPVETPADAESNRERRNTFKDSVHNTVKPAVVPPVDVAPPAAAVAAASPVKEQQRVAADSPKQKVSIMSRTTSQSDDKTPEKSGKEMSVQTTPSLKATETPPPPTTTTTAAAPVPGQPEFESPPAKPEVKSVEKSRPVEVKSVEKPKPVEVKEKVKPVTTEGKAKPEPKVKSKPAEVKPEAKVKKVPEPIRVKENEAKAKKTSETAKKISESEAVKEEKKTEVDKKIEGETMIIEDKTEKVNGKSGLEISSIINGAETGIAATEEVQSSEESSTSECKFETPPATPSAVILTEEEKPKAEKEEEEVVPAPLTDTPTPAAPVEEVAAPEVKKEEKKEEPVVPEKVEEVVAVAVEEEEEVKVVEEPDREEGELTAGEEEEPAPVIEEEEEPKGPFTYSREDMLTLREAQDKPLPNLPKFDCIMDKPILKCEPMKARPSTQFVPSWEASKSRSRDQRNRSMDKNHASRHSNQPRIIDHVLQQPVTRKKSSNAWLAKREQDGSDPKKDPAKILRGKIVSILNKITPQNFKELSMEVMMQNIDCQEKVDLVVEIIFEKALSEPAFSETYANLCKVLCSIKLKDDPSPNPKVSPFRKALLNRCQKEFCREKDVEEKMDKQIFDLMHNTEISEAERTVQKEELLYQRTKMKKKMLGNINFIGELFNLNLISPKIIICQCISTLLEQKKEDNVLERIDDEKIECLSKLFTTVGQKLEKECETEEKKKLFEQHFGTYSKLQSDKNYPYRIRFMIQDVMDLRSNGWTPRRQEVKPQKIEDIHRQHEKQEQEKKMEATLAQQRNKSKSHSRDERPKSRDKAEFSMNKQPRMDFKSIQSTIKDHGQKTMDSARIHLGPSQYQWGRGSGGGSGANSPLSGSREDLTTSNRFEMKGRGPSLMVPGKTASAPAPRKNMERERQEAIAQARALGRPGNRTPSHSPVRSTSTEKVDKPDEKIRERTKVILTEYFDTEDWEEAIECIKDEIDFVKKHNIFVEESINIVMEAKSTCTSLLADLYERMFAHDPPQMTSEGLLNGFQPAFECAADLAMDFPRIYDVFGALLAKCLAKEHINLKILKGALEPLKSVDKAGEVMCAVIKHSLEVLGSKGCMEIQRRWGKEKMSWSGLTDNPAQLIEDFKLDFLSSSCDDVSSSSPPDINFTLHLATLIQDRKSTDEIFKYIDSTIPKSSQKEESFIKELAVVCVKPCLTPSPEDSESISVSEDAFAFITPVMQKYVAVERVSDTRLETAVLDSMQKLFSDMSFPRDLPISVFEKLYDSGIITEEGLRYWKEHGREQQGHGVIRQHLKNFFEDLSGSDSDSTDQQ